MYYWNLFFIYACLGHLLEKILYPQHASGILYGFWTPVYGIGALIIVISYQLLEKKWKLEKGKKFLSIFFIGFFFLSFIEWLGGNLIEILFHITFWDYSQMKFAIGKYTSLEMALLWGAASIFLIYVIQPWCRKIAEKIPKWITLPLIVLFIGDIIATIILKTK